jgi:hypothetical protein
MNKEIINRFKKDKGIDINQVNMKSSFKSEFTEKHEMIEK